MENRPIEYYELQVAFSGVSLESYGILSGDERPEVMFEIGEITDE